MKSQFRIVFGIALVVLALLANYADATNLTTDQILNASFDSSAGALKVQWAKNDAEIISALTNTVQNVFGVQHTTTGTPANGIGVGLYFVQETSSLNNETGMIFEALTTDVTGTSEDFDFVLKLMAAGAAAAEKFRVTSTGVVTLVNAATLDNSTNGTLAIAEPTIYINGAMKNKECTIADGDATPDVAGCRVMKTSANTGATAITDLDNPVVGSFVTIVGGSATNSSTIADSGNFSLTGAFTAGLNDTLTLYVVADNNYAEVSRADN